MLDSRCWTLDAGFWTLDFDAGPWLIDTFVKWVFCGEYVLTWMVLEFFLNVTCYIIKEHQLKKLLYDKIGLDQKKIQKQTSRAILVRKSLKKAPLKKSHSLEKTTDWQSGGAILHHQLKWHHQERFLGIFRNFLQQLDIVVCRRK